MKLSTPDEHNFGRFRFTYCRTDKDSRVMAREDHMVAAIIAKVRNRRRLYQGEASIATMKGVDYLSFIIASDLLLDAVRWIRIRCHVVGSQFSDTNLVCVFTYVKTVYWHTY